MKPAEDAEAHLLLFAEATSALLASPETPDVLRTIIGLARRFGSADGYAVWRQQPGNDDVWALVSSAGLSDEFIRHGIAHRESSLALDRPLVFERVADEPALGSRREALRKEGICSMLVTPLHVHGAPTGAVTLYWKLPHRFTESEVRTAVALGNMAASALATAELYERQIELRAQAEAAERRTAFLSEAGVVFGSSLDCQTTLRSVARLAISRFADWCAVDLNRDGDLERVTLEHVDPAKVQLAHEYRLKYPPQEDDVSIVAFRTGEPFLIEQIPQDLLEQRITDREQLRMIRAMGIESLMVVPMVHRGRTLGLLTFVSSRPDQLYSKADLALAQQLASRAAMAIDNAQLYADVRASEARYRSLVSATTSVVWTAERSGRFDQPQPSWEAYTGQSWDTHRGYGWSRAIHHDDIRAVWRAWFKARRNENIFEVEGRLWNVAAGAYRFCLARAIPVRNDDGLVSEWVGTVTDIHDRRCADEERNVLYQRSQEAQAALRKSNEDLRRANDDLNQFAYSASHDLQEPLRMVSAFTQLLRRRYQGKLDPQADQYIDYAVSGAQHMEELLHDLLSYTQATTLLDGEAGPSDSSAALQKALSNIQQAITSSGACIEFDSLPVVSVAEVHAVQLFQNLVGNAIKYAGEQTPVVKIAALRIPNGWQFSVHDNGIGIEPRFKQQIFGIFKRLHASSHFTGTGIGLAICQKICERYGGRIWVDSEPGKGSTFHFTLPDR